MKYLSLFFVLAFTIQIRAQAPLTIPPLQTNYGTLSFTSHAYDFEDHWIAFPKNLKTGKITFGYVYLDMTAGYTCQVEGSFQVDAQGIVFRDSTDFIKNAFVKVRLAPNTLPVSPLPDGLLASLKLPLVPTWLSIYKKPANDRSNVATKVTIGKFLNSAGGPKKALEYLESAYTTDPHAAGLEFELTYSYNELQQYDKAISILDAAIAHNPDNPMFYKELGFAYMRSNNMEKAIKTYNDGIAVSKQHRMTERDEMGLNLSFAYGGLQQYDNAIKALDDAIVDFPTELRLYIQKAAMCNKAGKFDNAITTYTQAIDVTKSAELEQRAQIAWSIALIYRDQKKDMAQYAVWGKKS